MLNLNSLSNNIKLQQNQLKLRLESEMLGTHQLMLIQLKSPDSLVVGKATKLLVGLVTCYDIHSLTKAPEILNEFTHSLVSYTLEHTYNEDLVIRALMLLKALLRERDQSVNKSSRIFIRESTSRDFKQIYIDTSKNIRHLREEAAALYNEEFEKTVLSINEKRYTIVDDDIELSSLKFYLVVASFYEGEICEFSTHDTLAKNHEIFNFLFSLLSDADRKYSDLACTLLMALPINQSLKNEIKALTKPLDQLIDQTSMYKFLYELNIIQTLSMKPEWTEKFYLKGGLEYLLTVYLLPKQLIKSSLSAKFEEKIVTVLGTLCREAASVADRAAFCKKLLESLYIVSLSIEQKSYSEFFDKLSKLFLGSVDKGIFLTITQDSLFPALLSSTLITCPDTLFSSHSFSLLHELTLFTTASSEVLQVLLDKLLAALDSPKLSTYYWALVSQLVKHSTPSAQLTELMSYLHRTVQSSVGERTSTEHNAVLSGTLKVLGKGWKLSGLVPDSSCVEIYLNQCLFDKSAKSKDRETRKNTFKLVLELCKLSEAFSRKVFEFLGQFHEEPQWRTACKADWTISPVAEEKSETGFVGLENLGCTCYMNSLFQQFFMLRSFREGLLQCPVSAPYEENLLYQLQFVLSGLKNSDKQYIVPEHFTNAFKDFEGNPVNVREQMDVDEFFSTLMDRVEPYTEHSALIPSHFGGLQVTELIGQDCVHRSERYEPFLTIPIEVKDKNSILEGLESFVEGETLEGENAYQCDNCDAKVKAVRRVCVKHLPNHLIVVLRRFEFDFDTMNRQKLNDYCEFPMELNMQPYTQEGLERLESEKDKQAGKDIEVPPQKFPDEYYQYRLRGVVIHIGTAESGHYYSFIHDKEQDSWFEFNDTLVRRINEEDIADECFGGQERVSWSYTTGTLATEFREKFGNAYMLFYERPSTYKVREGDDESLTPVELQVTEHSLAEHFACIKDENMRFWRSKHIFGEDYMEFVRKVAGLQVPPAEFLAKLLVTILLRSKEKRRSLIAVYSCVERSLHREGMAEWVLHLLSYPYVTQELLIFCPVFIMRKLVVSLVKAALQFVDCQVAETVLLRFCRSFAYANKQNTKYFAQYFEVLKCIALVFPSVGCEQALADKLVEALLGHHPCFPEPPAERFGDISLGYAQSNCRPPVEKDEWGFGDSKGASFCHVYEYLSKCAESISPALQSQLLRPDMLEKVFKDLNNKTIAWWIGSLYGRLCKDSLEASNCYLNFFTNHFKQAEFYCRHNILRLFTTFFIETDSLYNEKVGAFLEFFFKLVVSSKHPHDVESSLKYLFKLSTRFPRIRQRIAEDKQKELERISSWLQMHLKSTAAHYKLGATHYEEVEKNTYRVMLGKVAKLIHAEPPNAPEEWDSDSELTQKTFPSTDQVLISDQIGSNWIEGKVEAKLGDLVLVSYCQLNSASQSWRDFYSEKVRASKVDKQ